MDSHHFDLYHPLPVTDNDNSNVNDPLLGLADDGYYSTSETWPNDSAQPHESTNQELDITSSYPIANFYTYPEPPPLEGLSAPGYGWPQPFPPTTGHSQGLQGEGVMQSSFEGMDILNVMPALNTIHHDNPISFMSLGLPTVRVPESSSSDFDSMPSSTQNSASGTPPPPDNEGRSPNTRGTARFYCADCDTSSKTKRDHERHLTTKKHQKKTGDGSGSESGAVLGFHCLAQDCEYAREGGKTFTRKDNLMRHIGTAHLIRSTA